MSFDDRPAPGEARQDWHTGAAERDAALLAEGPDDDTETDDSPWREQPEPVEPTAEEEFAGRMDAADRATTVLGELARQQGGPTGTRGETAWQPGDPARGVDVVLTRQHAAYREALAALVGAVTELAGAIDTATRTLQQHAAYDRRREQRYARDEVLRPYRFTGGPWDGKSTEQPRAFSSPHHCMPTRDQTPGHGTWAAADAWPGRNRYAPDGTDGDVVLMTWRLPTGGELADAKVRREIRDEENRQEFALDAAADAAADAATDGA